MQERRQQRQHVLDVAVVDGERGRHQPEAERQQQRQERPDRDEHSLLVQPGTCSVTRRMASRRAGGTAKSMRLDAAVDRGRIKRGKYTFVTRCVLPTIDIAALPSVDPKMFHASSPAKLNTK